MIWTQFQKILCSASIERVRGESGQIVKKLYRRKLCSRKTDRNFVYFFASIVIFFLLRRFKWNRTLEYSEAKRLWKFRAQVKWTAAPECFFFSFAQRIAYCCSIEDEKKLFMWIGLVVECLCLHTRQCYTVFSVYVKMDLARSYGFSHLDTNHRHLHDKNDSFFFASLLNMPNKGNWIDLSKSIASVVSCLVPFAKIFYESAFRLNATYICEWPWHYFLVWPANKTHFLHFVRTTLMLWDSRICCW